MLRTLHLVAVGALSFCCFTTITYAQGLDVQATLEPFSNEGGFEHGRLVLRIHNETAFPVSGVQVRLEGSALDLNGNQVMQVDRIESGAIAMATETYSSTTETTDSLLPMRITYSGPSGEEEVRLASHTWKAGGEE